MEAAVQPVCASCGNPALPDGKLCLFCGDVLTASREKASTMANLPNPNSESESATPEPPEYAGFWLRVWAGAVDVTMEVLAALLLTLIVDAAMRLIGPKYGLSRITASYVTGIAFILLLTIGAWLYCAFTESS